VEVVKGPDNTRKMRLTRMVEQHQSSLLTLCYAYLHERQLAEDAVQETFLRAYRALDTFRGECEEKTWLTSIAINVCRSMPRSAWFRRVNRRITPEEMPDEPWAYDKQDAAELAWAIQRLPDKLREVVLLYYYQELTMPEIAKIAGVTASMVSRRIKKAHRHLRDALGKEDSHG
jgi:RNA polymerase sigma-70 factor (ECF subfamily)